MSVDPPVTDKGEAVERNNLSRNIEPTAPAVHYELTNHLGNVLSVITPDASDATQPAIESLTDYYPFGMEEPGRSYGAEGYRLEI